MPPIIQAQEGALRLPAVDAPGIVDVIKPAEFGYERIASQFGGPTPFAVLGNYSDANAGEKAGGYALLNLKTRALVVPDEKLKEVYSVTCGLNGAALARSRLLTGLRESLI